MVLVVMILAVGVTSAGKEAKPQAPACDIDGNQSSFSDSEMAIVQSVWLRVAEDYAPFDVDITTQDPGLGAIDRTTNSDASFGTRVVVTTDNVVYSQCACAGLSYV